METSRPRNLDLDTPVEAFLDAVFPYGDAPPAEQRLISQNLGCENLPPVSRASREPQDYERTYTVSTDAVSYIYLSKLAPTQVDHDIDNELMMLHKSIYDRYFEYLPPELHNQSRFPKSLYEPQASHGRTTPDQHMLLQQSRLSALIDTIISARVDIVEKASVIKEMIDAAATTYPDWENQGSQFFTDCMRKIGRKQQTPLTLPGITDSRQLLSMPMFHTGFTERAQTSLTRFLSGRYTRY